MRPAAVAAAPLLALLVATAGCPSTGPKPGEPPKDAARPAVAAAPLPPPDPREVAISAAVVTLLENQHLRKRPIDDEVSRKAYAHYLEELDPGKMFLLAGDVAGLAVYETTIDDQLRAGRLELAHAGGALFRRRVGVVAAVVAELLAAPLEHGDAEWLETDPKKLELAASEADLRDRWRRRLELEVLERVQLMEERATALAEAEAKKAAGKPSKGKGKKSIPVEPARPDPAEGADADDDEAGVPPLSAAQIPPTAEGREAKARADLAKSYAGRFARLATAAPLGPAGALVNAVTSVFDPHTNYLLPVDEANFEQGMRGTLEGIGALLREDDHYVRVMEIVPGGAAWREGSLEAGDLILSVTQEGKEPVDTADMRIDDVVQMIRGPKGSGVTLSVQKPTEEVVAIEITRDVVVIEDTFARGAVVTPKGGRPLGYIYLPSFYGGIGSARGRSAAADLRRLLAELSKKQVAGIVLDLRGNGGGLLDDARVMTGLFIDKGPVVQTEVAGGRPEIEADDEAGVSFAGPVVVMTDRFSASASEIVAGALQDYHRGVVVGTGPTHGKGTVQVIADLDRGAEPPVAERLGALKLTVRQFFRVSGSSTQWKGVVPDIQLPDPAGFLETGERQLENSIPWSEIAPLPHEDWAATWNVPALLAKSQARRAASPTFGKIDARTALLKARREDTRVPLERSAWLAQRAEQKKALDAVTPDLEKGPRRLTVAVVPYDGAAPVGARPGGQADRRLDRWQDSVARDPWIEESLHVLGDMLAKK